MSAFKSSLNVVHFDQKMDALHSIHWLIKKITFLDSTQKKLFYYLILFEIDQLETLGIASTQSAILFQILYKN